MLNDQINKYKQLYTQLIDEFTSLHNNHVLFMQTRGRIPGFASRKNLRAIEKLSKLLKRQSQFVYKENLANIRLEKARLREEKKNKKKKKNNDMVIPK